MIENLNYRSKDLLKFFKTYNKYFAGEVNGNVFTKSKDNVVKFKFKISGHINANSLTIFSPDYSQNIVSPSTTRPTRLRNSVNVGIGAEVEYIMPFNKNKWGIFLNPNLNYYTDELKIDAKMANIDYKAIELPIGLRYYMYLKNDSKVFMNIGLLNEFPKKYQITFKPYGNPIDMGRSACFLIGAGYSFKHLNAEFRIYSPRNILDYYNLWSSKFQKSSVILSYQF